MDNRKIKRIILIISFSELHRDPRVYRQILFLKNKYKIIVAGLSKSLVEDVEFVKLNQYSRSFLNKIIRIYKFINSKYEDAYWSDPLVQNALNVLNKIKADIILANDITTLPLACHIAKKHNSKIIIDAHEYTPRDYEKRYIVWKEYWDSICHSYLHKVNDMFTVCKGLADEYSKNYNIKCSVLTNAPFYENLTPKPIQEGKIKMIHHGGLSRYRKLENMVYLMDLLDERFTLNFMLVNNIPRDYNKLKSLCRGVKNINFVDPVPMTKISKKINSYDIGLFLLNPKAFSYKMALPNKLFEFIQGRLMVAIWPNPEMTRIVNKYNNGIVSDDFTIESMAKKLNELTSEEIMKFKWNAHYSASQLCAEENSKYLLKSVETLLK